MAKYPFLPTVPVIECCNVCSNDCIAKFNLEVLLNMFNII